MPELKVPVEMETLVRCPNTSSEDENTFCPVISYNSKLTMQ